MRAERESREREQRESAGRESKVSRVRAKIDQRERIERKQ